MSITLKKNGVSTYRICLDRIPVTPWCRGSKGLILIGLSVSSPGHGSSSRLGSLWVEASFSRTQGSVQLTSLTGLFEQGMSSGD